MAKIMPFPQKIETPNPAHIAMKSIENRMGVSFLEYMGLAGDQQEVKEKIARAMRKETMKLASQYNK